MGVGQLGSERRADRHHRFHTGQWSAGGVLRLTDPVVFFEGGEGGGGGVQGQPDRHERINKYEGMYGWMDRWMDGWMDVHMYICRHMHVCMCMHRLVHGWMNECIMCVYMCV